MSFYCNIRLCHRPRVRELQLGGAAPLRVLLPTASRGRTSPGRATPSMRPSSWFRGPRRRSPLQVSRPWCRKCTERAVSCTLAGDRPFSFRRAGRSRPRAGRPSPALHRMERRLFCLVRDVSASPKAACSRQRIARSPPPAALPDAAQRWRGAAAPLQQLLRRGAARRRARAHSVDGWTTVYDQDGRPRAMPDELVGAPANRCCALLRQHDEPPYTLQPQNRAARDEASHTHYRHTTSATRRPAREKRTAHFKFVCDRAPSNCAEPGSRRGRRHGLQLDGDGAASRRRYGGGRVYMELTIDGWASRPAGGLVWPDGVKASSMEGPVRRHEADRSN